MREKNVLIFFTYECKVINNHYESQRKDGKQTMKSQIKSLMILAMCGMLVGCNSKYGKVSGSPYDLLNGRTSKKAYETLTTSGIGTLNYLVTSEASDADHFANFVDGLVTHNEFGVLELNLAESASHNADYTEFTFKLRNDKNLVWLTYNGKPYKYNGQTQYVKAGDFLASAKAVLTYSNESKTAYMYTDFVRGAAEYYLYTRILDGQAKGNKTFTNLTTDQKKADWIQKTLLAEYPNVYEAGNYAKNKVTAAMIADIAAGNRLGVTVDDAAGTIKYSLLSSAMYFPTMLTYSPFLPVNQNFYTEKGSTFGTSAKDSILYCGPYYLSQSDETAIVYSRNKTYAKRADIHGYNSVHVDKVVMSIASADIDYSYIRQQFENGNIDGFTISPTDDVGWKKYIEGPDGTGTYDKPFNGLVNSRLLDTIGYAYGSNIVMERTKDSNSKQSYSSKGSAEAIANTERALRLQSVRVALQSAFDYPTYYARKTSDGDSDSIFATQELVHTYVPEGFVMDNNENEYVKTYYAKELANYEGITQDQAYASIERGQFKTRMETKEQVWEKVQAAQADIAAYNADAALVAKYGAITYPINIEYFAIKDGTDYLDDVEFINSMNKRLNNIDDLGKDDVNCTIFHMIPTDKCNSNNYKTVDGSSGGGAAFDYSAVMWGWGADYGDPLTYLNTYTYGGDWGSVFSFLKQDYVPNIINNGSGVEEKDLLKDYTDLVRQGAKENKNLTTRYTYFAQAEVMLIKELAIYMPQTNNGQGWAISISKTAGYETPTANYGISNNRLTGLWVLKDPLTREERTTLREQYEANKKAYIEAHGTINIYD